MKKKLINLLLTLSMAFAVIGFVGCKDDKPDNTQSSVESTIPPSSEDSTPPTSEQPPEKENFTGITFPDKTVTYNGNAHSLELVGVPTFATVNYDKETSYTNAGTYTVKATVTADNYNTLELSATLTIEKATVEGISFAGETYTYDGTKKSLAITGNLPDGVSVSYENNDQINADTYTVKAIFTVNGNYNAIADKTATLKINKATVEGIAFNGATYTYDGTEKSLAITGNLPDGVSVSYENNDQINADTYTVTAKFTVNGNYNAIPDKTATLVIQKAGIQGISFTGETYTYDGTKKSLAITGELPDGVSVSYENNDQINAETYTVKAKFTVNDNYNAIPDMTATLTIEKKELIVAFSGETALTYTGEVQKTISATPTNLVDGDSVEITLTYSGEMIEKGDYTVTASIDEQNYKLTQNNTVQVKISRAVHTLTFKQEGFADVTLTVNDLENITARIPQPQKITGYDIVWVWGENDYTKVTDSWTITAQKTAIPYTLTYEMNNGKNADNPTTYTVEDEIVLKTPTREHYDFVEWQYNGEKIEQIPVGSYGDKTITAIWAPHIYTVSYNFDGGVEIEKPVTSIHIEQQFPIALNLQRAPKDNAVFDGWYFDEDFTIPATQLTEAQDTVIYVKWIQATEGLQYEGKTVTDYTGTATEVIIAEWYNGAQITAIGSSAFQGCSNLTSVAIPDGVTVIANSAFYGCSSLTSIVIPDNVTSIGNYAFYNCSSLTKINYTGTIDDWAMINFVSSSSNPLYYAKKLYINDVEVTDVVLTKATEINAYAFYNCSSLTSVVVSDDVTSIGEDAFNRCSSLTSITVSTGNTAYQSIDGNLYSKDGKTLIQYAIGKTATTFTIPDSVDSIGESAFYGCSGLASIVIPDSVTTIGNYAFYNCSSLTSVTIGNNVTTIGYGAFKKCSSLTSIEIPDSVTEINADAFFNCSNLKNVELSQNSQLTYIGSDAFCFCTELRNFNIPNKVTTIGESAFAGCRNLLSVTIPESVTYIAMDAFSYGCNRLTIYCEATTQPSKWNGFWNDDDCPVVWGCEEFYTDEQGFGYVFSSMSAKIISYDGIATDLLIPNAAQGRKVTAIGKRVFAGCEYLTNVVIPDCVDSIGEYAFDGCEYLTTLVIPDSVTSIRRDAFDGCTKLMQIVNGVKYVDTWVVGCDYNSGITSAVIREGTKGISWYAFHNTKLTSVIIPDSVTEINWYAFDGCKNLARVYYGGTSEQWSAIGVFFYNNDLTNATRYYYSETEPTLNAEGTAYDGNYWHYDNNGEIVVWTKETVATE